MRYRCTYCETMVEKKPGADGTTISCPSCSGPLEELPVVYAEPAPIYRGRPVLQQNLPYREPSTRGVAPFVFSIIALMGSFVPCFNVFFFVLALVGLAVCATGVLSTRTSRGTSLYPAGCLLNMIAIVIVVGMMVLLFSSSESTVDTLADNPDANKPEETRELFSDAIPYGQWSPPINDIEIQVISVSREETPHKPSPDQGFGDLFLDSLFTVTLNLRNVGEEEVTYRPFHVPSNHPNTRVASLVDDNGNIYEVADVTDSSPIAEQYTLAPGKDNTRTQLITFKPVPGYVRRVYLKLPNENLGGLKGTTLFAIRIDGEDVVYPEEADDLFGGYNNNIVESEVDDLFGGDNDDLFEGEADDLFGENDKE